MVVAKAIGEYDMIVQTFYNSMDYLMSKVVKVKKVVFGVRKKRTSKLHLKL